MSRLSVTPQRSILDEEEDEPTTSADEHERRFLRAEAARLRRDPAALAARAALEGATGSPLPALLDSPRLTLVTVPSGEWADPVRAALRAFARDGQPPASLRGGEAPEGPRTTDWGFAELTGRPGCGGLDRTMLAMSAGLPTVVVAADGARVPAGLREAADAVLRLAPPSWDDVRRVAEDIHGPGAGWPASPGPRALAAITPLVLRLCLRRGQTALEFGERLARAVRGMAPAADGSRAGPRGLARVPGLPAEVEGWALSLVRDLALYRRGSIPWAEVDRGAVLAGPPGCGKSTLARALAEEAEVHLVVGSHGQWQGARDGHLGTTLGAMRQTFAEARSAAPCILLIDEVDSFPDRASVRHDHADYSRALVNGLLSELDGAVSRDGVVVIGTCNEPGGLDPALTRPGRLERVLTLGPPDGRGVEAALRVHLGAALADEPLADIAVLAQGMTGAEVEAAVRAAKRAARVLGRRMLRGDLLMAVAEARQMELLPPTTWPVC